MQAVREPMNSASVTLGNFSLWESLLWVFARVLFLSLSKSSLHFLKRDRFISLGSRRVPHIENLPLAWSFGLTEFGFVGLHGDVGFVWFCGVGTPTVGLK